MGSEISPSDDCSRSTDYDFDDQPSPAELSDLYKVTNAYLILLLWLKKYKPLQNYERLMLNPI